MTADPGLASWLTLSLTPGLGGATLRNLLKRFGLPQQVLAARRSSLSAALGGAVLSALDSEPVAKAVARAMEWAAQPGQHIVTLADEHYPRMLLETADPPAVLYCAGRLELLARPALAIVGSRNATAQGARDAASFAAALAGAGLTIVSGLALGIDAAAHRGAVETEASTIAVLGCGIDVLYPSANARLGELIRARGLLLSEFALGTAPAAHNFPRRNRLISGLSRGCLVIEAALASGSLITARSAAEQGREVFAIPGSIHAPLSKGCHALIKAGAKLVESAEDVLSELGGAPNIGSAGRGGPQLAAAAGAAEPLLDHMGYAPVDLDSLCLRAGLPAERIATELLRLELAGRIASLPGGLYQRLN